MEILLEMEGTVCNLNAGISKLLGIPLSEIVITKTGEIDYGALQTNAKTIEQELSEQDVKFWEELPVLSEGLEIVNFLQAEKLPIRILTRPYDPIVSQNGKKAWAENHLKGIPVVFTRSKHVFASQNTLLIDEKPGTIQAFKRSGGKGILLPRPWQLNYKGQQNVSEFVISQLKELACAA